MYQLPNDRELFQCLCRILEPVYNLAEITSRRRLLETSTYPVECVTCIMEDGLVKEFFCKYLAGGGPNAYGHRGGVEYEAKVYSELLKDLPLTKINYYGECRLGRSDMLIVLEFLGNYLRFVKSGDPEGLPKAARWVGSFHRFMEKKNPPYLRTYSRDYYYKWVHNFRAVNDRLWPSFPALQRLVDLFEWHLPIMIDTTQTIIHGEYYPRNILMREGIIYPVDWESAAVAPGEIDLASLIEDWPQKEVHRTIQAYKEARWPNCEEDEKAIMNRLLMSRIYFFIRYCPWNTKPEEWISNEYIYRNMLHLINEAENITDPVTGSVT